MKTISPNEKCSCGSGKKYKFCCAKSPAVPFQNISGIIVNPDEGQSFIVTKDILINQLNRDTQKISASFDKLCDKDIKELSKLQSKVILILYTGLIKLVKTTDELRSTCVSLLFNANTSFTAAVQLLRGGYRLQPGILVRNIIETISTVLYLINTPGKLNSFKEEKLESPKTITAAKRILPTLGKLYGFFSNNYAHISKIHQSIHLLNEYKERDETLDSNIGFLRIALWLIYVTSELTYIDIVEKPRYWEVISSNKYAYNPSENEKQWFRSFMHLK